MESNFVLDSQPFSAWKFNNFHSRRIDLVRNFGGFAAAGLTLFVLAPVSAFANREIQCESIGFGYWPCSIGSGYAEATVSKQLSDAACFQGQTYGIDRSSLWVSGGCRAAFSVFK